MSDAITITVQDEQSFVTTINAGERGARGQSGAKGADAYESYLATTTDDPVLSEAEWSESNIPPVTSVAGKTGDVVLLKSDVGLPDVDNTSDSGKPVSTLHQIELNLRLLISSIVDTVTSTATDKALSANQGRVLAEMVDTQGLPGGGIAGQVLAKASSSDFDSEWINANPFNQSLNTTDSVRFSGLGLTGDMHTTGRIMIPDGSHNNLSIVFDSARSTGIYKAGSGFAIVAGGNLSANFAGGGVTVRGLGIQGHTNARPFGFSLKRGSVAWGPNTTMDVNLSRVGVGQIAVGNGTDQNATGSLIAAEFESNDSTKGVILKSENGTRYRVQVDNSGALTTTAI